MSGIKLCRDCKWSRPESEGSSMLCCTNIIINRRDSLVLGSASTRIGVACYQERDKRWPSPCGMRGALFEAKGE